LSRLVVDVSVAMQWYTVEDGHRESRALLDLGHEFIAPSLALAEFGNVCWKKVRRGEMSRTSAEEAMASFASDIVSFVPMDSYAGIALRFALDHNVTVYESQYAVLALATDSTLVTNDTVLYAAIAAVSPSAVAFPSRFPA
jgi:predicted nucleic acid-binding protein